MSILFCTPCYGGQITAAHFQSCMNLKEELTKAGLPHDWLIMWNESLIQRARNNLVASFLKTSWQKLMFLDADIEFAPEDVHRLWEMNKPVAAGIYAMKKPGKDDYAAWVNGKLVKGEDLDKLPNPCKADFVGTGFLMIDRSVFEKMIWAYPEREHESHAGKCWAWFDPRVEGYCYWYEDYAFCKDWQNIQGEIWIDPTIRLKHHGTYAYGS